MEFTEHLADTSGIPEFAVGGPARAEIIDGCMVRVTFYKPVTNGETVKIPVVELVWSIPAWLAARDALAAFAMELAQARQDVHARHH